MKFQSYAFPAILLFILTETFTGCECLRYTLPNVTYEDIEGLNATCKGADSCYQPRPDDAEEEYNCNCGSFCSRLGTCCFDSEYRQDYLEWPKNVLCYQYKDDFLRKYYTYLLISTCDDNSENDETAVKLCHGSGEELNDPFLKIPVTNPVTGITYKNYYCYACNANHTEEEPIPWNVGMKSFGAIKNASIENIVGFDMKSHSWLLESGEEVELKPYVPNELKKVVYQQYCKISTITAYCESNWTDTEIQKKCYAYMALTRIRGDNGTVEYYRNPHCAICNNRNTENMTCYSWKTYYSTYSGGRTFFVGLFNLRGKSSDCEDNMAYDYFAKKCRRVFRAKRKLQ